MSDQLDYEATKAALRAQLAQTPSASAGISTRARAWLGVVSSLIVVTCAVVLTVWMTSDPPTASVVMVPSGDHNGGASTSSTDDTAGVALIPGAPDLLGRTAVIRADGSISGLDAAGNPVTIATPSAEQTAAVLRIQRATGTNPAAPVRPVTAAVTPPREVATRPTAPRSGGGSGAAPTVPPSNPQPPGPSPTTPQPSPSPPPVTTQEPAPTPDPTPTRDPSPTTNDPAPDDRSGGDPADDGGGNP